MTLKELIDRVGQENIVVEYITDNLIGAKQRKGGATEIRVLTNQMTCNQIATGDTPKVGVIIWLPKDKYLAALAGK